MAPVIKALAGTRGTRPVVVVTAQHREMVDQMLSVFSIKPDHDLNIMSPRQTLFRTTARILEGLEKVILDERPSMILVQGDTTSTFAGALAAYYLKGVAHKDVELIEIFKGIMPYLGIVLFAMVLLYTFPQIALWLPEYLFG